MIVHDQQPTTEQLFLRPREVATRLGVSYSTVMAWCYAGLLPSIKIGKCRRIRVSDLDAFLTQEEERPR